MGVSSKSSTSEQALAWLGDALGLAQNETPFPWQQRLLRSFCDGVVPSALDLPTGLGKTSVIAIWLVARALSAQLPRRLVYVVDRRAVVDQATKVAVGLRRWVGSNRAIAQNLGLVGEEGCAASLPVSTLRGQFADNRQWLEDPSLPAIIIGTVDKIGSKLLFEGYGTSYKMRPYHAALLGQDSLVVLDESHLVPPFEHLINTIAAGQRRATAACDGGLSAEPALGPVIDSPYLAPLRVLSLSATSQRRRGATFSLDDEDREHAVVQQRIFAKKRLEVHEPIEDKDLPNELAKKAWDIAEGSERPVRCIVYCNRREHAEKTKEELLRLAKDSRKLAGTSGLPDSNAMLFVGARRFFEREQEETKLEILGFVAGSSEQLIDHAFLFATSAAEVGVDLDADHMVADLVAWERMVQRLGRVNRRGNGEAQAHILPSDAILSQAADAVRTQNGYDANAVRTLLERLPALESGGRDASPAALGKLHTDHEQMLLIAQASTCEPLHPGLSRPLVDSWAMTSLRDHTGRPEVAPWLRGWVDDEPQTTVAWREHLSGIFDNLSPRDRRRFIEATPLYGLEKLEIRTSLVVDWLMKRAQQLSQKKVDNSQATSTPLAPALSGAAVVALPLDSAMELVGEHGSTAALAWTLADLSVDDANRRNAIKRDLERELAGRILVVDAQIGGLSRDGLLDAKCDEAPVVADSIPAWKSGESDPSLSPEQVPWRVRITDTKNDPAMGTRDKGWRERLRLPWGEQSLAGADKIEKWLIVDRHHFESATEDDRSMASQLQTLAEHQSWASDRARRLCAQLHFPGDVAKAIVCATRLHDEGKRATTWQRAFQAPSQHGPYAKTPGPLHVASLKGYRHEFGSLPYAAADSEFQSLSSELQDLALHLIAAHHGGARPTISSQGCEDAPPSRLLAREQEVALRYERLQRRYGPWGLAYLESILRAADQQASRANDERNQQDGQS